MRDFTWHVFTQTGDIEAYLLYKEMDGLGVSAPAVDGMSELDDGNSGDEE